MLLKRTDFLCSGTQGLQTQKEYEFQICDSVQQFFFHFYLFVSSVNLVQDLRHPPQHQNMKCPLEMLLLVGDGQGQTNLGQFSIILRAQNKILWFFSIFSSKIKHVQDLLGLSVGLSGTHCGIVWDCLGLPEAAWDSLGLYGTLWDFLGLTWTVWCCLGLSGIVWESLRLSGTL